jgi:hypothetical protein
MCALAVRARTAPIGAHELSLSFETASGVSLFVIMTSLEQVRIALVAKLGSEDKLALLNARLILRTGVNLSSIEPKHARDAGRISKVVAALREMGFDLEHSLDR